MDAPEPHGAVIGMATAQVAKRPPPAGVEKTPHATVRYAFGLSSVNASAPEIVAATQNVEKFLTSPLAEPPSLPNGFNISTNSPECVFRNDLCNVMGLSLVTKRKKPMAALFVYDNQDEKDGYLVIALRGDRNKQTNHRILEMDQNTVDAFTSMVYTTNPKEPCNFHPWFSSIVLGVLNDPLQPHTRSIVAVDSKLSHLVSNAINNGRVLIAVCLPIPSSSESALHKLAIDKAMPLCTPSVVLEHKERWLELAEKPLLEGALHKLAIDKAMPLCTPSVLLRDKESWAELTKKPLLASKMYERFKEMSSAIQLFAKTVAEMKPATSSKPPVAVSASKRGAAAVNGDDLESAPKRARVENSMPTSGQDDSQEKDVAPKQPERVEKQDKPTKKQKQKQPKQPDETKKSNKEKKESKCETSGQSKFIAEALQGSRSEEEREEREGLKFQKKLNKIKDSDSEDESGSESESDNESVKKKKAKKKSKKKDVSDSESEEESELSDSDDSEEDSSEDESSDEENSDEESEEDASATSSDEEDQPKKKHKRLVKASDVKHTNGPNFTQTTLDINSGMASSSVTSTEPKRKLVNRPPPAQGNRAGVAAHCNMMLDKVEASNRMPLSSVPKISSMVSELRQGWSDYESDKFPIKKTYPLHTKSYDLLGAVLDIHNAGITQDQINTDTDTLSRLAVDFTSALVKMPPMLEQVSENLHRGIAMVETFQKMISDVAKDFKVSASNIEAD